MGYQHKAPTTFYQPNIDSKPKRHYIGNGLKFEDWLARKRQNMNVSKVLDSEEEKQKVAELRSIMAQEKFKQWLDGKIKKRKESQLTERQTYEQQNSSLVESDRMPFETWLEQKKEQDRTLRKLRRQIRQDE